MDIPQLAVLRRNLLHNLETVIHKNQPTEFDSMRIFFLTDDQRNAIQIRQVSWDRKCR